MEYASQKTDDAAYLIVRSGYDSLCIDRSLGANSILIHFDIGHRLPLGVGASGIALIAFLPDDEIEKILAFNKLRYKDFPKLNRNVIRSLITECRELGYARNEEYFENGVTAVGIPIINDRGETIASITVASITNRMSLERSRDVAKMLQSRTASFWHGPA